MSSDLHTHLSFLSPGCLGSQEVVEWLQWPHLPTPAFSSHSVLTRKVCFTISIFLCKRWQISQLMKGVPLKFSRVSWIRLIWPTRYAGTSSGTKHIQHKECQLGNWKGTLIFPLSFQMHIKLWIIWQLGWFESPATVSESKKWHCALIPMQYCTKTIKPKYLLDSEILYFSNFYDNTGDLSNYNSVVTGVKCSNTIPTTNMTFPLPVPPPQSPTHNSLLPWRHKQI